MNKVISVVLGLMISATISYGNEYLFNGESLFSILVDRDDYGTVHIATNHFQKDLKLVFGKSGELCKNPIDANKNLIIIGSIKKSKYIKKLVNDGLLDVRRIKDKWESFIIQIVNNPFPNVKKALVIAGSDRRGTAFAIFEVSKRLGVSPWYWWADITPEKKRMVSLKDLPVIEGEPSVKYRGIFLNDEDWGLKPWASNKMDRDIRDIGPKTYSRIFELLLRLKGNFIWPAMHGCTKSFYYYPNNPKVAEQYAIVVGSSHCEPMLRNNIDEWKRNFRKEYGKRPGPWRYDRNQKEIYKYWYDRVKESKNFESVYTVGMRGISDGSMPGGRNFRDKIALLNKVIKDQREMLNKVFGDSSKIPQIFCPYKEVLKLYEAGINLPSDVTIVWADDNHGYIRRLSNNEEQKRSGHSGIYYHLSYWGPPEDYLWLSSISPAKIAFEMQKAYAYGADRLWVFNVGDLKPAEKELSFAMDLAWNIKDYPLTKACDYPVDWYKRFFPANFANKIGAIMNSYYRLAAAGKPEHLTKVNFTIKELNKRLDEYQKIVKETEDIYKQMPDSKKNAFYQLYLYPIKATMLMNQKFAYAKKCQTAKNQKEFNAYAQKSKQAYQQIKLLTAYYNKKMANGKWDGMMSMNPRSRKVFGMPNIGRFTKAKLASSVLNQKDKILLVRNATDYNKIVNNKTSKIIKIDALGVSGSSISKQPFTAPTIKFDKYKNAPMVEYDLNIPIKNFVIIVKCLPTHCINSEHNLQYAIAIDNQPAKIVNLHAKSRTKIWDKNVTRGFSMGETSHTIPKTGKHKLKIYILDSGLAINSFTICPIKIKNKQTKIVIIGDSIVATYKGRIAKKRQGWGQNITKFLKRKENIVVKNFAISGRSSKTFKKDWQRKVRKEITSNTFVLIQFGHNDSHKASRIESTDPKTTFTANILAYIKDIKALGGTPILITPPYRRCFDKDGKLLSYMLNNKSMGPSNLAPFAAAMRQIARKNHIFLIDLHAESGKLLQKLGSVKSAHLFFDIAHSTPLGATTQAKIILNKFLTAKHPLAKYIDLKKLQP